jgi:hypothetical protein
VDRPVEVEIVTQPVINELLDKIEHQSALAGMDRHVRTWFETNGEIHTKAARTYAVVGRNLMFVHPCPDGVLLPFEVYPSGRVKAYCDAAHAGESFD